MNKILEPIMFVVAYPIVYIHTYIYMYV